MFVTARSLKLVVMSLFSTLKKSDHLVTVIGVLYAKSKQRLENDEKKWCETNLS